MPYILKEDRKKFEHIIEVFEAFHKKCFPEEVAYFILRLCQLYLDKQGEKYTNHNTIMGVLTCARLEYLRRKEFTVYHLPSIISVKETERFKSLVEEIDNKNLVTTDGELNYLITMLIKTYVKYNKPTDIVNDILHTVALRWYNRKVSKYEQKKVQENGDVY